MSVVAAASIFLFASNILADDGLDDESCPSNSHGSFGDCICDGNATYVKADNLCFKCPENVIKGIYPYCICNDEYYSKTGEICVECPKNSTGQLLLNIENDFVYKVSLFFIDFLQGSIQIANAIMDITVKLLKFVSSVQRTQLVS